MDFNITLSVCLIFSGVCLVRAESGSDDIGGWSNSTCQEDAEHNLCFNVRTCTPSPSFSCPTKHNEVTPTSCPCDPEWATWNPWVCHSYQNSCIQIRLRECSNNYTQTDCENNGDNSKSSEIIPCDNITCQLTSSTTSAQATTLPTSSIFTYPYSITPPASSGLLTTSYLPVAPEWATWNPWVCPQHQIACVKVRFRECLHNYNKSDCEKIGGESYEIVPCDDTCKSTQGKTTNQMQASATPPPQGGFTTKFPTVVSDNTTMTSVNQNLNPSSTYASQTTSSNLTFSHTATQPATNGMLTTSNPSVAPASPYVYWLEWTGWECENISVCLMSRTRNCSTLRPDDCEDNIGRGHYKVEPCKKEICPAIWSEWSVWSCKMEFYGVCNMTRSRKCSTESAADCGDTSIEHRPCDNATCPGLYNLENSGMCLKFGLQNDCTDDASFCKFVNEKGAQICLMDESIATKICPKACGCCQVDPHWTSWSAWTCERTSTMCRMKQNRTCSTGNITDCEGMSEIEAVCDVSICGEPSWGSWSCWKCHLQPNNTCEMSRKRLCDDGNFCAGPSHEENECTSEDCPDFVGYKVDCSLQDTKFGVCEDGTGCQKFEDAPKTLCTEGVGPKECPITCGCCIPSFTTPTRSPGGNSTIPGSGSTQNTSGSGTNGYSTHMVTTNIMASLTTNDPSGSGGTGNSSLITTDIPGGVTTLSPHESGGTGTTGSSSVVSTLNTGDISTQNSPGSGGTVTTGSSSMGSTMNPVGASTQNPAGSSTSGTDTVISTVNSGGVSIQNPYGSSTSGTGSMVSTENPGGVSTQNPSGSDGTVTVGSTSMVSTINPVGSSTQNPAGSSTSGSGSVVSTVNSGGVSIQNPYGSSTSGTGSMVSTVNPGGVSTQNPSGSGGTVTAGLTSMVSTINQVGPSTQNPTGSSTSGTGSMMSTVYPGGVSTQNPSGSDGTVTTGSSSMISTIKPGGVSTPNTSEYSTSGTGESNVSTVNSGGFSTQNPFGSGSAVPTSLSSVVSTINQGGVSQNPSVSTVNTGGVSTQNPSGTGYTNATISSSFESTVNQGAISTQNPLGSGGTDSVSYSSVKTTVKSSVVISETTTTSPTLATTSLAVKTTTHKQPHTPKPAVVRCNVCSGPDFLCEKLFEETDCAPPNNYCINKLTNHIDGTRMVTRHCGNFDTCYREWFLGSSDSDKCRNYEENNIITLDFDCTYCCSEDGCNLPIKPSDDLLYKDL